MAESDSEEPRNLGDASEQARELFDFGSLVQQLPLIVYFDYLDETEPSIFVSSKLEDILGYPTNDWLVDDEFWFNHLHPEDQDRAWDAYEASLTTTSDRYDEYRMVAADGSVVWIEERARVIPGRPGEKGIIQGVMLDITDRKRAEMLKDTLLRSVSHDLKSPLAAIIGSVHTMLLPGVSFSGEDYQEFLRGILRAARQMDHIVSDLLDLERLEQGSMSPRRETVDLADVLRNVVDDVEQEQVARIVVDPRPAIVRVDRGMVERIVDNLVRNAIRYSSEDGKIHVSAGVQEDGNALLCVDDDGPGIPADKRENVFEPFVQVGEHQGGAGIGLALVREFTELHGGRAWVEESAGHGAAFRVLLPPDET